jgi:quinol monooxygenase YgiN
MQPFGPTYLLVVGLVLLMSSLFASPAPGQEKPNPLVAQVKAAVKDSTKPFTLLIRFEAKPGAGSKIEAAFTKAVPATRKEKGCLAYEFNRDAKMPTRYLVYERWQNLAALEAHQNSAHIAELRREINDLRTGAHVAEVLVSVGE